MTNDEIMEYISEALHNLRDDYPLERKALAHRAFGNLMGHFNWHPDITTILQENGTILQKFLYKDKFKSMFREA